MNDKNDQSATQPEDSLSAGEIQELKDKFGITIESGEGLKDSLVKLRATRERLEEIEKKALKKYQRGNGLNEGV